MFKWLNEQFAVEEKVEISTPAPKNISEPVLSIIEALKDSTNWRHLVTSHLSESSLKTIVHISSGLKLGFTIYGYPRKIVLCHDTWVTPDESVALGEAYLEFYVKDKERIAREYQHMVNQIEREKFMEAFVK